MTDARNVILAAIGKWKPGTDDRVIASSIVHDLKASGHLTQAPVPEFRAPEEGD